MGLGYEVDLSGATEEYLVPDPLADASVTLEHPMYARIRVPWSVLEREPGAYDWDEVDRVVDRYREASYEVVLALYGGNRAIDPAGSLPSAERAPILKAWLE
ncbi:MAG: hypothetical protein ACE5JR_11950, partial [Gemmatimonadota bacterium]